MKGGAEDETTPSGDVHTAVWMFLQWVAGDYSLPADHLALVRMGCLHQMYAKVQCLSCEAAKSYLAVGDWKPALAIATAAAYPRNILHSFGSNCYKSSYTEDDSQRTALEMPLMVTFIRAVCLSPISIFRFWIPAGL